MYNVHPLYSVLSPGEEILWEGRPCRNSPVIGRRLLQQYIFFLLMAASIPGFLWYIGEMPATVAAAVFVALQLIITFGCGGDYLLTRYHLRNDLYLVTDRRVMILVPARQGQGYVSRASRKLQDVSVVSIVPEDGGFATLCIDPQKSDPHRGDSFCLYYLENGEAVADLIRRN